MTVKKALFAGGCFWCMESPFTKVDGVIEVIPGYTGGKTENPTYEEVCSGNSGHLEAVEITYDSEKTGFRELAGIFWKQIDPTDSGGQFADRGSQYTTAIFVYDDEQRNAAAESLDDLKKSGKFTKSIATKILSAGPFYRAEEYHQKFYVKNPERYSQYRSGSGREEFLKKIWQNSD